MTLTTRLIGHYNYIPPSEPPISIQRGPVPQINLERGQMLYPTYPNSDPNQTMIDVSIWNAIDHHYEFTVVEMDGPHI